MANRHPREVLFEFVVQGSYVKVSAVDSATGTEVAIVGDPLAGEETLKRLALRKLERALNAGSGGAPRPKSGGYPSGWDL